MAQTIKLKRSAVASKVPLTTDVALGELAINTFDGKLYFKKNVSGTETIIELANVGHVHAATDITSGTISTARLGSGTANSTTFLRGDNTWATVSGSGTVTSVAFSTGTTGLTVTGSPITTNGTITLAGTLAVANGGTGATSAATALTNLGAAADSAVVKLTGTQTVGGAKTFSDITTVSNTTQSTTATNGALVVSGGLGVAKTIRAAEDSYFNGVKFGKVNGTDNVVIGNENTARALSSSNTSVFALGAGVMQSPTANSLGSNNMAIGTGAMFWHGSTTSPGTENVAVGSYAMQFHTTGIRNTAIGTLALEDVSSGSNNNGIGFYSLLNVTSGSDNIGIGSQAGSVISTGGSNVCIGSLSLGATNGSSNVAIGTHAGWKQNNGTTDATGLNNCVFVGNATRSNGNNQTNQIVIGVNALGDGSNTTVIGNAETISTKLFGKTTSQTNTATTNAVVHGLRTEHQSTGTPATGIGTGIEFAAETAANNTEVGATIEAVTTDVTAASEDFDLSFKLMTNGATAAEKFRIKSNGDLVLGSGPATLSSPSGTAPLFLARAWVRFNGSGTPAIAGSGNVSSITDNGTGLYQINFTTAMPNANYSAVGMAEVGSNLQVNNGGLVSIRRASTYSTTALQIVTNNIGQGGSSLEDLLKICVVIFG